MRTQSHVRNKMLDDLARLGLRSRRVHDTRRTFITLARVDGARKDILEAVTHGPRGNIMDAYTTLPWPTLCEAVACLKLRRVGGEVVRLRLAANAVREHGAQASETGSESAEADPPLVTNRVTSVENRAVFVRKSSTKHTISVSGSGGGGGNRSDSAPHASRPNPTDKSVFGDSGTGRAGRNEADVSTLVTDLSQLRTALEGAKKALARDQNLDAALHIDFALALVRKTGRRPRMRRVPNR